MASPVPGREPLIPSVIDDWPDGHDSYDFHEGELIGVIIMYTILLLNLLMMVYAVIRARAYKPLRAKQPHSLFYAVIAAVFWITGSNVSTRVFPYPANLSPAYCQFFVCWAQFVLGAFGVLHFFFLRLWKLYAIFQGARPNRTFTWQTYWLPHLLFATPALIIGILTSALRLTDLVVLDTGEVICYAYDPFIYATYAGMFIYFVILSVLSYRLRKVHIAYFNEYRRLMASMGAALVVWIISFCIMGTDSHNQVWGRVLNGCLYAIVLTVVIGILIGDAVFYSIFAPAAFEERFLQQTSPSGGRGGGASSASSQKTSTAAHTPSASKVSPEGKKGTKTTVTAAAADDEELSTLDAHSVMMDLEAMRRASNAEEQA